MGNAENLQPVRTKKEARERGKIGGIASGTSRRQKREIKMALLALMEHVENGQTGAERIAAVLFKKAIDGDIRAIMLLNNYVEAGNKKEKFLEDMGMLDPW